MAGGLTYTAEYRTETTDFANASEKSISQYGGWGHWFYRQFGIAHDSSFHRAQVIYEQYWGVGNSAGS